ncbi:DUF4148 domain-containing protein [Pseudorhodoferax sp. LjRoot39]|uniref:DUF4148 domain-containing protein n=1 Tax=Pseudorhodoferax sp. LjRoot39 TaxID=3342328 RepID=UPI003ED06A62
MRYVKPAAIIAACLLAPFSSFAASEYHFVGGEIGFTRHPDHAQSQRSRADVVAELEAARRDGTLALMQRSLPLPVKDLGQAKTRAQVEAEVVAARKDGTLDLMQRSLPIPNRAGAR